MDMNELRLQSLKTKCRDMRPRTRRRIVSDIKDWIWGDIEGTFDYAVEHGYLKKAGENWDGDLWVATEKLQKYDKPEY